MKTTFYINSPHIQAGITVKDAAAPELNNMALHSCNDEAAVLENRRLLANDLHTDLHHFVFANQTHSANVHRVERADFGRGALTTNDAIADTDALYTFERDVTLGTFTADCVPVFFYEEESGLIGVIHSGWQGTIKEISSEVMRILTDVEHIDASKLHVHIGPALSQEKFEVDEDVYSKFDALGYASPFMYFKEETKKFHIDNQQVVRKQFERAGVLSSNITIDTTCTFLSAEGFSYRQNKRDGRHLTFIKQK